MCTEVQGLRFGAGIKTKSVLNWVGPGYQATRLLFVLLARSSSEVVQSPSCQYGWQADASSTEKIQRGTRSLINTITLSGYTPIPTRRSARIAREIRLIL
jgi:hypothetical protein